MGSFLVYFINRGTISRILEGLQKVVVGEKVETTQPDTEVLYAGFWRRFGAFIIDTLLLYLVMGLVSAIFFGIVRGTADGTTNRGRNSTLLIMNILTIVFFGMLWLYYAIMESSSSQATLGKKLFHIKVTNTQGNRLSFGKATARFWLKALSFIILGIGFIITAFTGKKQALHDLIAGTLVVQDQS
uniref:RDD family protein n=1 Tax=Gracilinema caldarium TaxID=215591 RepID=A0A7C3IDC6_9SPIR